jgi:hypothetical protein
MPKRLASDGVLTGDAIGSCSRFLFGVDSANRPSKDGPGRLSPALLEVDRFAESRIENPDGRPLTGLAVGAGRLILIEAGPVGGSFGFDVDAAAWTGFGPVETDSDVDVGGATVVDAFAIGATAGDVVTTGDLRTIVQEGCTVSSLMGGVMFYNVTGQHTKPFDTVCASPTHPAHLAHVLPLCSSRLARSVSVFQASLTNVCDLIEGVFEVIIDQIRDLSFLRTRLPISVAYLSGGLCGGTYKFQKQKV